MKLELFGSALREDFSESSDFDLLVTFDPQSNWGLWDHTQMEDELSALLGRKTDLISRRAIESSHNAIRRNAILGDAVPVYVSQ